MNPPVCRERLETAALILESAIQQRLRSRNNRTIINFELDVFRYSFGETRTTLLSNSDFEKLPLSPHWYYTINGKGRGTQLSFPVKAEPRLWMKKLHVYKDGELVFFSVPVERLVITSATEGLVISSVNKQNN